MLSVSGTGRQSQDVLSERLTQARKVMACVKLKSIEGLENLGVCNVTAMRDLFDSCRAPCEVNLSVWDTSAATDMNGML